MNVALLGGSFNPPHVGHLMAATYVHATRDVTQVWLVPSFKHPFGKEMVSFEHRLAMCRALAEGADWLSVCEVERDGGGFTVDTLTHLTRVHPDHRFLWVIGSDIVKDLPQWKDVGRVRALAQLCVLQRSGFPSPEAVGPPLVAVSSTLVRQALARGESPDALVPRGVLRYISDQKLYR